MKKLREKVKRQRGKRKKKIMWTIWEAQEEEAENNC